MVLLFRATFQKKKQIPMWHFVVLNRRMNEFLSFDLLQIGLNPKMVFNLFLFLQHIQAINFELIQFGAPTINSHRQIFPCCVLSKQIWADMCYTDFGRDQIPKPKKVNTIAHFGLWIIMFGCLLSILVSSLSFAYRIYASNVALHEQMSIEQQRTYKMLNSEQNDFWFEKDLHKARFHDW